MAAPKSRLSLILIYVLLLAGSVVFALPFLWMAASSVKVDWELFTDRIHIIPLTPRPAAQSPYVDLRTFRDLTGPKQKQSLAVLQDELSKRTTGFRLPGSIEAAADSVYQNLVRTSPAPFWDAADLDQKLRAAADAANLGAIVRPALRELGIGSMRLLGKQGEEIAVPDEERPAGRWNVSSPGVEVAFDAPADPSFPGTAVHYDFENGRRIVLWKNPALPFPRDDFFGVRVSIHPDDSWHRMTAYVKLGDRWMVGRRPFYLAYTSGAITDVTWQLPSGADQTNRVKSWLILDALKEAPADLQPLAGSSPCSVFLVVDRSSAVHAWWGKIARNYLLTFTTLPFWRYFATSVFITALNIGFTIFSCSLVAFAFSRLTWPGRDTLFAILLATMMVPAQVTMIPQFLIYKALGFYNTLTPLWFGALFANAFFVFLMRQFMKSIPRDLEDAARIDGCGFWSLYWRIIMPLVRPALASIAIFTFLGSWNDFMTPLIYLSDERLYTLSLGLYSFRVELGGGDQALLMAGCFLMLLPVILIFFFAQRYFIQGVTITGIK